MNIVLRQSAPTCHALRSFFAITCAITCFGALMLSAVPASAIEPGEKAPNFKASRLEGSGSLGLSDYRGKVVYLDFRGS